MYYLGVDGGGTHTTAVVADKNANILARADGKSINYNSIGLDTARRNMCEIVYWLLDACHIDAFACAFIGMSAISERASDEEIERFVGGILPADKIIMDSDVFIALSALSAEETCAVTISGTGSMVAGRTNDGKILHTGGWGYILGDEGSSYAIALDALKAAVRGIEKSAPETTLTDAALDFYGADKPLSLIDIFYDPPMERSKIAAFTIKVFECAENDDKIAKDILRKNAKELSQTALALLRDLQGCTSLGLWGGVFENHKDYLNMFRRHIIKEFPEMNIGLLTCPPVVGAVMAAIREGGRDNG